MREVPYADGYACGKRMCKAYPYLPIKEKSDVKDFGGEMRRRARDGNQFASGFMTGWRDAADERKSKKDKSVSGGIISAMHEAVKKRK